MKIYKLSYENKEAGMEDLLSKGVYVIDEEGQLELGEGIGAVAEIGEVVLKYGTYDNDLNVITPPIFAEGYHFDVVSEKEIVFENEVHPKNPKHKFMWQYKN